MKPVTTWGLVADGARTRIAVSIASVLLLTEATMTEIPDAKLEPAIPSEMAM